MKNPLNEILRKAEREEGLAREEIAFLLNLEDTGQEGLLFQTARNLRRRFFGDTVFLYGFLYLSTYCRNDCRFCYYRRSNTNSVRYRRNESEILDAARQLADSGVHLIDLTMGEDPKFYNGTQANFDWLVHLVSEVKRVCICPVMVSPGVIPVTAIRDFKQAGANWFACYQETFNKKLFANLRPQQSYEERLHIKAVALANGLLVEDGLLCGVGESCDDLAHALVEMDRLGASQMRAMTFVPQPGTPMANRPAPDGLQELKVIAALRLVYPHILIPASLDVAGLDGLKPRLDAGANVVTSIVPPGTGLAGVAHPTLDIGDARRTTTSIRTVLSANGLQAATGADYRDWIDTERKRIRSECIQERIRCA